MSRRKTDVRVSSSGAEGLVSHGRNPLLLPLGLGEPRVTQRVQLDQQPGPLGEGCNLPRESSKEAASKI